MSYHNIASSPEAYGLRTIGEVEFSDGSYEFDTTIVWQDVETKAFYYADDAGCSCPSPFEDEDRSTIIRINRLQDLIDHLEERKGNCYRYADARDYAGSSVVSEIDGECASLIQAYRAAKAAKR